MYDFPPLASEKSGHGLARLNKAERMIGYGNENDNEERTDDRVWKRGRQ